MTKKGRPVKETPVSTPEDLVLPAETSAAVETHVQNQAQLNDTAYGVTKLPTGQHVLVRIRYDAVSGLVGTPELDIVRGDDRMDAEERLKIVLADELLQWG